MADRLSKCLVIDASIARSAGGEDATYPTSVYCRDFLQAVLTICHKVAMTEEIRKEWDKHQSRFARRWIASMIAKKKLIPYPDISLDEELWRRIIAIIQEDKEQAIMFKDFHLIEASLQSDKIIISLDDEVRKLFAQAALSADELKMIIWVNPAKEEENAIAWLEEGAKPDTSRCLGTFKREE